MDGMNPGEFDGFEDGEPVDPTRSDARGDARAVRRVFSVPPGTPFLPTLVRTLLDGTLAPGFPATAADGRPDPLALADATIYVPTRRAARELRATFVAEMASGGVATASFLPTIRALGDVDEGAGWFEEAAPHALTLPPVIDPTLRTIALARLTLAWIRQLPDYLAETQEGAPIEVPSSPADAVWLARDLEGLMDEMERQGTDWSELVAIDPGEHARWWQLTVQFLSIVTEHWPAYLAAHERLNPGEHGNRMLRAEAERLRTEGSPGPVIVAASPNLGPATVDLIDAAACLPNGAVLLPGLDTVLSEDEFRGLAGAMEAEPEPAHPNHGLARLLADLGLHRRDVEPLGERTDACALRERLIGEAMRPAASTHRWVRTLADLPDPLPALEDVTLVEAPGEREEALAIACALRRGIEETGATAALVTPDRALARRVAAELRRFGIEADDSAGRPILSTPVGSLMRLALRSAMRPDDAHALLGLLKHPMARFGLSRSVVRRATLAIELVALRSGGPPEPVDALGLMERFDARLAEIDDPDTRTPHWRPRFTDEALHEARDLIDRLRTALFLLADARTNDMPFNPSVWAANIAYTLDQVGEDAEGGHDRLWGDEAGEALAAQLRALMAVDPVEEDGFDIAWHEVEATFDALLSGVAVRPAPRGHPRVAILGLIESRLLSPDTLVLGGLNEGAWPRQTTTDQFLSRPMRGMLRLEPPERRIGLEAHDFAMGMGAAEVVLTRSTRSGTSPTVPSRWLQRLQAVLQRPKDGETGDAMVDGPAWTAMRARGTDLLATARALDDAPSSARATRPGPTPPLEARATDFSVTEIETLRRDPYAHYARRILRLEPLPDPRAEPDARERGTLIHEIVEAFVKGGDPAAPDAGTRLIALGRTMFGRARLPDHIHALWWSHFEGMVPGYLAWERERAADVVDRIAERGGGVEVLAASDGAPAIRLKARADRIDVMNDGTVELIDYKTGTTPAIREARSLLAPQLALEAAMAARGGFAGVGRPRTSSLVYVRLRPGEDAYGKPNAHGETIETGKPDDPTADAIAARAWGQLGALLARYRDPGQPYPSRLMPQREGAMDGPYDHLARAREWGVGDGEDGGGEGDAE